MEIDSQEKNGAARIKPQLLSWACERAGYELDALAHRFPKLTARVRGTAKPAVTS